MGTMGTNMADNETVKTLLATNLANNGVSSADLPTQVLAYATHYGAWKWCFWIPACIAVAGALVLFIGIRDEPKEVGLPDLPDTGLGNYQEANRHH